MDLMVTGWPAASNVAAAGGGARGEHGTEGEKEGGGVLEDQHLTRSTTAWSVWPEEGRRRRNGARRRRPEAE